MSDGVELHPKSSRAESNEESGLRNRITGVTRGENED